MAIGVCPELKAAGVVWYHVNRHDTAPERSMHRIKNKEGKLVEKAWTEN
ncbi:MAG: hypothetical protein K2I07_09525 [Lachnospiraceae bacterium]|nr:hypothetical protein [Lachnospiraceae bacterium]